MQSETPLGTKAVSRDDIFDVAICGAGLAGLAIARRISMALPDLRLILLDRLKAPLPESAFKVGESTIEVGAHYLSDVLQLGDHFRRNQLPKLGLRYFYPSRSGPFEDRPELGLSHFPGTGSFQIDRGLLENHLRATISGSSITFEEGCYIEDCEIHSDGSPQTITCVLGSGVRYRIRARWVIDATGRRRLLQRKLNLGLEGSGACSASWFRIAGKLDISCLVKAGSAWRSRVSESRWYSTNHLMGKGYWVWLIPLSPGNTSVGIVAMNQFHTVDEYNTLDRARRWIEKHEPDLGEWIIGQRVLDFKTLKSYSYSSRQVFSTNRWGCIGEAAVFADPYYSVGSNMIAFGGELLLQMIALEQQKALTNGFVEYANTFFLGLNDSLTQGIQSFYPYYDSASIMCLKTIWDFYIGWSITDARFYNRSFLSVDKAKEAARITAPVATAQIRMHSVLKEWAERGSRLTFDYIDYLEDLPTLRGLFEKTLRQRDFSSNTTLDSLQCSMLQIKDLAQAIFLLAVEDTLPGRIKDIKRHSWSQFRRISLNDDRWEADGVLEPESEQRELPSIWHELRNLFHLKKDRSELGFRTGNDR